MRAGLPARNRTVVGLTVASLVFVAGCYTGSQASAPPAGPTDPPSSSGPEATPSAPTETFGLCGSADLFIDYAPYTTSTLAGYGWDFVVADVVGFEQAIFNTPDGKAPADFLKPPATLKPDPNAETLVYTPVNVVVDDPISGSWSRGAGQFLVEGGTVPVEGGTVDCYTVRVDNAPHVEPGSRYMFIVSEALDSGGKNPLLRSKARFAWPVDAKGMVVTVDGPMSLNDLAEIVDSATPSSVPQPQETGASN
jgi:hypothetical protein